MLERALFRTETSAVYKEVDPFPVVFRRRQTKLIVLIFQEELFFPLFLWDWFKAFLHRAQTHYQDLAAKIKEKDKWFNDFSTNKGNICIEGFEYSFYFPLIYYFANARKLSKINEQFRCTSS